MYDTFMKHALRLALYTKNISIFFYQKVKQNYFSVNEVCVYFRLMEYLESGENQTWRRRFVCSKEFTVLSATHNYLFSMNNPTYIYIYSISVITSKMHVYR